MTQLIVLAFLWALRLLLPARGGHRAPDARAAQDGRGICGWYRPFPVHLLVRNMPLPESSRLVPAYLEAWEQTPDSEKAAVLAQQAEEQAERWRQTQRRAAAFAVQLDLPDPLYWPDDATTADRVLAGVGA
ncbi:hypothetical protein PUR61_13895 [Streptomyces sp. BE20]|uniref:hypothetical protein n=1 Tax=Streptomyces sp. BE20 TaxID=3002525 RepID=UPI002E76FD8D|nr:hypothetical protein [Streptomyces sp. BE20]MEE1823273.1 hypothetical protein [Streptomyces sp. BE20]